MSFSINEVCKKSGVSPRCLRYWTKIGLVQASASTRKEGRKKLLYNLRDLLIVLVIKELRSNKLSLQKIRKSVDRVKEIWGESHPLAQLKVAYLSQSVVFKKGRGYIDALTGQYVIENALNKIRETVERKRYKHTELMVERAREEVIQKVAKM